MNDFDAAQDDLPPEAWLTALASLPAVGPMRMTALLAERTAATAWAEIGRNAMAAASRCGAPALGEQWRQAHRETEVGALWQQYESAGIGALGRQSPGYPEALGADIEPPAVLYTHGDPTSMSSLRVAVVGTRSCTRYGVDLARELGALLADSGVSVVSGLAAGIDTAAHSGALESGRTPPVGVVGTALDHPYPRQNRRLWADVASAGLLCGETPLGAPIERWRFPARNRIIAALSHVVVVVESHEAGGSLHTAAQAHERGRAVFAVPGSIRSPASAGTNRLLGDGCIPLCEPSDVLLAVGLVAPELPEPVPVELDSLGLDVVEAIGWRPCTLAALAAATAHSVDELAAAVERLVGAQVVSRRGPWLERTSVQIRAARPNGPPDPHSGRSRPRGA